ncbi:MAG: hypothetical protein GWM98_04625 [Nitrospinaceae bacterium]|nr:hypothetical protein [Deltaproteobacteria bacterium]NIY14204.1 hypothetical protein [Nitrospinaceae bacterium]
MKELLKLVPDLIKGIIDLAEGEQWDDLERACEILLPGEALKSRVALILAKAKASQAFKDKEEEV